jgi:hypothetical protein
LRFASSHYKPACNYLCQRYPPKQRSAIYFEHLFFNLFMHLATLKQVQSRLAVRSAKRHIFWASLPAQTRHPHLFLQMDRLTHKANPSLSIFKKNEASVTETIKTKK